MKVYSSDVVTPGQVQQAVSTAVETVSNSIDSIDKKQSRQIRQLRFFVAAAFVVNLMVSLLLFSRLS